MYSRKIFESELEAFKATTIKFLDNHLDQKRFMEQAKAFNVSVERDLKHFTLILDVPLGTLSLSQCETLYTLVTTYSFDALSIHSDNTLVLTSLTANDLFNIMQLCFENGLYTASFHPLSVAVSPRTGTTENELFDVMPYALLAYHHFENSASHPYEKLSVGFITAPEDMCLIEHYDVCFCATLSSNQPCFSLSFPSQVFQYTFDKPFLIVASDIIYVIQQLLKLRSQEDPSLGLDHLIEYLEKKGCLKTILSSI